MLLNFYLFHLVVEMLLTLVIWKCIEWQFFNLKSFLKFIQQYTWMFETDMRLFEYWLFWCSIFQLSSWEKRRIELRYISKRISFLKAIYAQSWWIYFAVVVLNVKEKMRKKKKSSIFNLYSGCRFRPIFGNRTYKKYNLCFHIHC